MNKKQKQGIVIEKQSDRYKSASVKDDQERFWGTGH